MSFHCSSVRSVGYGFLSMPYLYEIKLSEQPLSDLLPNCAGAHIPILDAIPGEHYPDITIHSEHQGYSWFIDSDDAPKIPFTTHNSFQVTLEILWTFVL